MVRGIQRKRGLNEAGTKEGYYRNRGSKEEMIRGSRNKGGGIMERGDKGKRGSGLKQGEQGIRRRGDRGKS